MFAIAVCFAHFNFYPRPPRGGRLVPQRGRNVFGAISTHALREEGDLKCGMLYRTSLFISTHALREEGDVKPD